MRRFFLLLVLTNLAMAGWLYWRSNYSEPTTEAKSVTPSQGVLRLLSEISPAKRPPDKAGSNNAPLALPIVTAIPTEDVTSAVSDTKDDNLGITKKPVCLRINSTIKAPDVTQISEKAESLVMKALASGEEMVERQSYWVYIPPYKSANAVRDAASLLAKSKVRDFLVVRSGEYKDGISLGLFSQQERAERRLQEIKKLKLAIKTPLIQPRSTMVRSYWLRVQLDNEGAAQRLISLLANDQFQTSSEECPP